MKPLPTNPYAFQARVMDALIGDISDLNTKTFPRLNALREVSKLNRDGVEANNLPPSNQ